MLLKRVQSLSFISNLVSCNGKKPFIGTSGTSIFENTNNPLIYIKVDK